jgi:hypothetical protein
MSPFSGRSRKPGQGATTSHLRLVPDPPDSVADRVQARRPRIEIVPLDGTAPSPAPVPHRPATPSTLAPPLAPPPAHDRRRHWPERPADADPFARLVCTSCGTPARIDLVDLATMRVHLSCDGCYRMWQDRIRSGDRIRPPARRRR